MSSSSSSAAAATINPSSLAPPAGFSSSSSITASRPHSPSSSSFLQNLGNLGLGYAIAIAIGLLVLLCTLVLASYLCCRASSRRRRGLNPSYPALAASGGVVLPRIIFVAEDDEEEGRDRDSSAAAVGGLDPAAIATYPKFLFSASAAKGEGDSTCPICLCDYREGEMLRMLPDCRHCFHLMCIDAWLRLNASCPVCRNSPMPTPVSTPLSTPLSEVVPLSQFASDRRRR
ncbi:RING-H2 finger protein ATL68 [Apostasia shenzhenica]|uniref:RING-H2 finger protein ATL68 n=1 Tax=Apostasia shenzhenica TaxID=1088818 RepID=A0A2I0B942_9ASPA|nr:RING-H2 finger protein ATL68 [Apostasia shenzhenica]